MEDTDKNLEFSDITETLDITKHISVTAESKDVIVVSESKELKSKTSRKVVIGENKSNSPQLSIFDSLSKASSKSPSKGRGVGKESFMNSFIKDKSESSDNNAVDEDNNVNNNVNNNVSAANDENITARKRSRPQRNTRRKVTSTSELVINQDDDYQDEFLVSDIAADKDNDDDDDDDFVLNEGDVDVEDDEEWKDNDIDQDETKELTSELQNNKKEAVSEVDDELPKKRRKTTRSNGTSKKKLQDSRKSPSKTPPTKAPRKSPSFNLSTKIVRGFKDLTSAKDKVMRMYGLNKEKLLGLAKIKEGFEAYLFDFPKDNINPESIYYENNLPPCATSNVYEELIQHNATNYEIITEDELKQVFKYRTEQLDVIIGKSEFNIGINDKAEFPLFEHYKRSGFIYNCGALITDMEWLNNDNDDRQYLAVSLSQYFDNPVAPELQMFGKETHYSCIEIFELNQNTDSFKKIQTILHPFGETWNLKWHEGCKNVNNIGVLSFVTQDGSIKLIEIIQNDDTNIKRLINAAISISLIDIKITCFDFLSPKTIICGLQNGYVAEFDLSDNERRNYPSVYEKISDSYIASVITTYSKFEDTTVNVISTDGYFTIFNPKDIFSTKLSPFRFRGYNKYPMTYIPQLYLTAFTDGCNGLKALHDRASFLPHPVGTKNTTITTLCSSRLHPYLISGTSDGEIFIDNLVRRALQGVKDVTKTHKSSKLWKWDYNLQTKQYRLDHNYEVNKISTNDVAKATLDYHGVTITATKWIQTSNMGKTFAFSNAAGILTIETLMSENK